MSSVVWNKSDNNIYLSIDGKWYRFDISAPPVGEGAMGIVHQGFDCDTHEMVAVKAIRPELLDNPSIRQRAKLEASVRIDHPNLVRMIGFCEMEPNRGALFVVSEYIEGITLDNYVRTNLRNMVSRQRISVIVQDFLSVLDAVEELHRHGVVHRDIKPENIMIHDGCVIKLMDLGIARAETFFDAHLCGFIGSEEYAAPEQFVNDDIEAVVDARTDIYALGVTLRELLTIHSDEMPDSLKNVIEVSTSPDPNDRFPDAASMRKELLLSLKKPDKKNDSSVLNLCLAVLILFIVILIFLI